jgi:hypothetical protein
MIIVRVCGIAMLVLVAALCAFVTPAAAQSMQPGLWEITGTMEMPGMAMPPMLTTQCIKDTGNADSIIPQAPDCTIQSRSMTGNTVRWSMQCRQGNSTMNGTGEITLGPSSYQGVMQMTMQDGGERTSMTTRYTGRRIGNC